MVPHHCLPLSAEGLRSLLGSLKSKECSQVCTKLLLPGGTSLYSLEWRGLTIRMVSLRIPTVVGFISFGAVSIHGNPGGGPLGGWILSLLLLAPLLYGWDWGLLHYLHSPDRLASFTLDLRRLLLNPECWFSLLTTEIDYMCSHCPGVVYELNNNTIYVGALLRQLNGRINTNTNIIAN